MFLTLSHLSLYEILINTSVYSTVSQYIYLTVLYIEKLLVHLKCLILIFYKFFHQIYPSRKTCKKYTKYRWRLRHYNLLPYGCQFNSIDLLNRVKIFRFHTPLLPSLKCLFRWCDNKKPTLSILCKVIWKDPTSQTLNCDGVLRVSCRKKKQTTWRSKVLSPTCGRSRILRTMRHCCPT